MFVLFLQTAFFAGALQPAGTTLQVPDNSVLTPQMKQVPAPVVPVAPAPVVAPAAVIPNGALRLRTSAVVNGAVQGAGTIIMLAPQTKGPSRTVASKKQNGAGADHEEALYDIFLNGQWMEAFS